MSLSIPTISEVEHGRSHSPENCADRHRKTPRYHLLLAATLFSHGDLEAAEGIVGEALALPDPPSMAWALRGMLALNEGDLEQARSDFQEAIRLRADSPWAAFGLARCFEQTARLSEALAEYDRTLASSVTDNHKSAAEQGRCRILLRLDRPDEAIRALKAAKVWQPSCDVTAIGQLADELAHEQVVAVIAQLPGPNADLVINNESLTKFEQLPLLNGDFELDLSRYWGNEAGLTWMNAQDAIRRPSRPAKRSTGDLNHWQFRTRPPAATRR